MENGREPPILAPLAPAARAAAGNSRPASRSSENSAQPSTREKILVGAGGLPMFFGSSGIKGLSVPVYQMMMAVDPALLGLALAIPRLWDGMIDPWVGKISDNCRSSRGRRRPFIIGGAIAMGVSYGLIWMASPDWSQSAKLLYFFLTCLLFYTCYAIFSVPYQSLTYELASDYNERTRVMAYVAVWGKAGEFLYQWIFPLSHLALFGGAVVGIRWLGWTVGLLILAGVGLLPALFGRERYFRMASRQSRVHLRPALADALRNRALVVLIALSLTTILAGMLASSMDYYVLVYDMFGGDIVAGSFWKGVLSSGYAVVGLLAIPPISWAATRWGKVPTLFAVQGLAIVGGIAKWFIFVAGHQWLLLLDPLVNGAFWVAVGMLYPSMIADVCDDDELRSGQRREGTFGAVFLWVQKTGMSFAFLGIGLLLNGLDFDAARGGDQSTSTLIGMRVLLSGSMILTAALGMGILAFYPIGRKKAEETRRELEARRGAV